MSGIKENNGIGVYFQKARVQESDILLPVYSYRAQDLHSYWQKIVIRVQSRDPYVVYMRISDSLDSGSSYVHKKLLLQLSFSMEIRIFSFFTLECLFSLK
jgi:hypothetical protein